MQEIWVQKKIFLKHVWNADSWTAQCCAESEQMVFLQGTSVQPFGYGKHGSRWVVRLETQSSSEPEREPASFDKFTNWFFKVKGMNLSYLEFLREYMWQCHGQWWQCSPFFSGKSVARPWRFLPLALAESAQQPWRQRQRHGDSAGESQTFPQRSYWWAVMPGDSWIHVKYGRYDCSSTHTFVLVFSEKFMKLPEKL